MGAKTYQDLDVWRLCEEIRERVSAELARRTGAEDRRFCEQLLGAAEDAVSNIAEGYGRYTPRDFARFLDYAVTSIAEVRERTRFAHARGYVSGDSAAAITILCVRATKALNALRRYLRSVERRDIPASPTHPRQRSRSRGK